MKNKVSISLSITFMIIVLLIIVLSNWIVLKDYNDLVTVSQSIDKSSAEHYIRLMFVIIFIEILYISLMVMIVYQLVNNTLESQKNYMERYIDLVDKYVITSSTNLRGIITNVSEAFCQISGYSKEELIGKSHNILRHEDMPKTLYETMWKTIVRGETWSGEIKNKKKDGSAYWVKAYISPIYEHKEIIGYTAVRENITDKKKMEELSVTDPLTELYNRRKFHKITTRELSRLKRDFEDHKENIHQVFFILLDVDHFKYYNDTYGHDKGDTVLQEIANILKWSLRRSTDYAFRMGGEEFGIIVVDENITDVKEYTDTIRKSIQEQKIEHKYNSASKYVTASFGIAIANEEFGYDIDILYNRADTALYKAKELGRNRIEVYKLHGKEDE